MFLALREIRKEKMRYGLIIAMIVLITYLLFMLLALMNGLSNENTAALKSWNAQTVWLNKNANDRLSQSIISQQQIGRYNPQHVAVIGDLPGQLARRHGAKHKANVQLVGLKSGDFIAKKKIQAISGHRIQHPGQIILDESLQNQGYHLGSKVTFNGSGHYQVVGFARNAKLNIAPIAYCSLGQWQQIQGNHATASGIVSDQTSTHHYVGLQRYTIDNFINKLPGYTAQNATFEMMIAFLLVISLVVIAVFLYILTMQKTKQYALLRAQGISAEQLMGAIIAQSLILIITGLVFAIVLTLLTVRLLPSGMPILLESCEMAWMTLAILGIGLLGASLPAIMIMRIDPLDALK